MPTDLSTPAQPLERVSAATTLLIAAGVIGLMKKHGLITPDGQAFDLTRSPEDWTLFAKDVDELLVELGVAVPANVQKAVNGAAFYLPIIKALVAQAK